MVRFALDADQGQVGVYGERVDQLFWGYEGCHARKRAIEKGRDLQRVVFQLSEIAAWEKEGTSKGAVLDPRLVWGKDRKGRQGTEAADRGFLPR